MCCFQGEPRLDRGGMPVVVEHVGAMMRAGAGCRAPGISNMDRPGYTGFFPPFHAVYPAGRNGRSFFFGRDKAYPSAGCGQAWLHELADGVEHDLELGVVSLL